MVRQDPKHTPHNYAGLEPGTLQAAVERTLVKLLRDVSVSVAPVLIIYFNTGTLETELLLPALGLGIYRGLRDISPALFGHLPKA